MTSEAPTAGRPGPTTAPAGPAGGAPCRYRSLFVIGRGGMGRVEVAIETGPNGFERIVALKRLLPEGAQDPRRKEMFLREARLAALLSHPNVVHAFAFGELDGELFLAMEYVEGEPLSQVLVAARKETQGLSAPLVAHVLAEACEGLHAAHDLRDASGHPLQVVHRDVSPHNVMVAYDGRVKLLDFGVAKLDGGGHATRTGEVKGKMAYMSPEQALGEKLDRRSDLFSVGAVLFECLAGRRLWGEGTDVDLMRKLALEEPPRLEDHAPDAPGPIARLCARLVARSPSDRPATAGEVAAELRAFAASASPRPDPAAVRALMARLFAEQARQRRRLLLEQLELAVPAQVEELRRSLEPGELHARPTWTEPVVLGRPSRAALPAWLRWAVLVGLGLAGVVAGRSVVKARTTGERVAPAPEGHEALREGARAAAPAASDTAAVAPAPATREVPQSVQVGPPPPGGVVGAALPTSAAPPPPSTLPARSPKLHPARPKPPDVDPSPF